MAQVAATDTIVGKLTGTAGASIANASVTAVNASTSERRSTTTAGDGSYEFSRMAAGTYTLRFSAPGYKTTEVRGIVLNDSGALAVDAALAPSSQAEEIDLQWVGAVAPGASAAAGATGEKITVKDIPLSTRNFTQAAGLATGVSSQVTNATAIGINSQGVQVGSSMTNNYMIDGAAVADNTMGAEAPGIPNPDAIQENKVQSWSYEAGPERNAGANIIVATRSGSNSFHGTVFEFVRNDMFNSNLFFLKREGYSRPVLKQNQFGFSLGGPILKDKAYFFGSYQGTRQSNGIDPSGFSSSVTLPPLPAMRTATTLGEYYCGSTGFFGGVAVDCNGENISQVAINILNLTLKNGSYYIPGSGTTGDKQVPFSLPAKFTENQFLVNTDYVPSGKEKIVERFFYGRDPQYSSFTGGPNTLPGSPAQIVSGNIYGVVRLESTPTPKLSNEMLISGLHDLKADTPLIPFTNEEDAGITSVVPQINILDVIQVNGLFNAGGGGYWDHYSINRYTWSDQLNWSRGRHEVRAGVEVGRRQWNVTVRGYSEGILNFNSFTDFLLGLPGCRPGDSACSAENPGATNGTAFSNIFNSTSSAMYAAAVTGSQGINHAYRFAQYSAYLQDEVKVNARLTALLGLRWEYFGLPHDSTGNMTSFWYKLGDAWTQPPSGGTYAGYIVPSNFKGELPSGVYRNSSEATIPTPAPLTNVAPRIGVTWQPLTRSSLTVRGGYGIFYDSNEPLMSTGATLMGVPYATPTGGFGAANYKASLAVPFPTASSGWGTARWADPTTGEGSNLTLRMFDAKITAPVTQKWNFEIQQQLPYKLILAVGYAGAHSIHMQNTGDEVNESVLASPSAPINGITLNTVANAAMRVPFLGIAPNGMDDQENRASGKYNGLLATLRKQMSHGVQVQAAYMFSKTLSDNSGFGMMNSNDPLNARQQYGPSTMSNPQRLALNYGWDLPYKGIGAKGRLLGDWGLSGTTIIQTGTPMTLTDPRGGTIYGNAGISRAQFCPGMSARNAPTTGSLEHRLNGYFNTGAFCAPPTIGDGTGYGNTSAGFIRGPGQDNTDLSVRKSIAIWETKMELRMEMFNAFNHPQFANPDTSVTDPTFGQILSASVNPRLIQFAAKFSF
jgi:hypothetical protein